MNRLMQFNTQLLHGKTSKGYANREILPPISQVNAYRYESMEELEQVFAHRAFGYAYSRIGNPTVAAFEQKICEMEGGAGAVCFSSGMSAIAAALLSVCESGDEIIAGCGLYGGTIALFRDLEQFGIRTIFAEKLTAEEVSGLLTEKTRLIFGEVISNPSLDILDIPRLSEVAHNAGVPLFVDSTTATPYLVKPLSLGADAVIHSTSKYINGSGNSIGGVVIDGGRFRWDFDKHTALSAYRKYGPLACLIRLQTDIREHFGGSIAPFNAYLNYIGVDTLGLRIERICSNADALAKALDALEGIEVNYPTLRQHPFHDYVERELSGFGGGILTFRAGSKERAFQIINALRYAMIASNIGDIRTLVIHPASTLYVQNSKEEQEAAGVYEDTIRVSLGIEDAEDLIRDFTAAVQSCRQ